MGKFPAPGLNQMNARMSVQLRLHNTAAFLLLWLNWMLQQYFLEREKISSPTEQGQHVEHNLKINLNFLKIIFLAKQRAHGKSKENNKNAAKIILLV